MQSGGFKGAREGWGESGLKRRAKKMDQFYLPGFSGGVAVSEHVWNIRARIFNGATLSRQIST